MPHTGVPGTSCITSSTSQMVPWRQTFLAIVHHRLQFESTATAQLTAPNLGSRSHRPRSSSGGGSSCFRQLAVFDTFLPTCRVPTPGRTAAAAASSASEGSQ